MSGSEEFYDQALQRVAGLKETRAELAQVLEYEQTVLEAQRNARRAFNVDLGRLDADLCRKRNSNGQPALNPEEVIVDWGLFDDVLGRIIEVARRYGEDLEGVDSIPLSSDGYEAWHEGLVAGFLREEALLSHAAERAGVSLGAFAFLSHQALVPFVEAYAEALSERYDTADWAHGRCPVCGAHPLMGWLEEETGGRQLHCCLCRMDWSFKRIGCPFCGNEDQQTLKFFYDEKDDIHRVEVCDKCKAYIKTTDTRKGGGCLVVPVEDLITLHLDLVARDEGYSSPANRLLGR